MTHKLIAVLVLLATSNIVVSAMIATTKVNASAFYSNPEAVYDSSAPSDSLFANASADAIFYSPGVTNDTIYVWVFNWNYSKNYSINVTKRTLDATTLTPKENDTTINTTIKSKIGAIGRPGIGYIGFPTIIDDDKENVDQLYFTVLAASATAETVPNKTNLTNNTDTKLGYYIADVWWQENSFFVLYVEYNKSSEYDIGIYLQGVKANDGSLVYPSSVKVATILNPPGTTFAIGGPNNSTNATKIYILWKDDPTKSIYQKVITVSDGSAGERTTLKTDTSSIAYYPGGIITSYSTYGSVIESEEDKKEKVIYGVTVFYNGSTSESKDLNLSTPRGYASPFIRSFNYTSGFSVVAEYSGTYNGSYVLRTFFADGSPQTAQKTIGSTQGTISFFTDANSALWAGYNDYNTTDGLATKGYLGQLLP